MPSASLAVLNAAQVGTLAGPARPRTGAEMPHRIAAAYADASQVVAPAGPARPRTGAALGVADMQQRIQVADALR